MPLSVSVNVSGRQLREASFVGDVAAALGAAGLAPDSLVLEITESVMMRDTGSMVERLRALKALGVRIAIDDFGTGYSSLGYLQRFPVDVLKVDKTFIDGLGRGPQESVLAQGIIALGTSLSLRTVAEGIEEPEQLERLREMGCEFGQGFFLSRPLPARELTELLRLRRIALVA